VDFDHGLNNAVKRIRAALEIQRKLRAISRHCRRMGYRFIGPIASNGNGTATARGTNGAAVAERETRVANEVGADIGERTPDGAVPGRLRWLTCRSRGGGCGIVFVAAPCARVACSDDGAFYFLSRGGIGAYFLPRRETRSRLRERR